MKILFVTKSLAEKQVDGGNIVSKRNLQMLINIYGRSSIDILELKKANLFTKFFNVLFTQSYAQTFSDFRGFKKRVDQTNYAFAFFNSSLYCTFEKYLSKQKIKIFTFFHNIEVNYYKEKLMTERTFFNFLFYKYIKKNEFEVVKYSNKNITLNLRDSQELCKIYGKKADFTYPITMPLIKKSKLVVNEPLKTEPYCLFLGSNFFANQQGIIWFINNVVPHIKTKLYIVGSICNAIKKSELKSDKIILHGYLEDIKSMYINASLVVSPIFSGSGMKTKTIEALSFGKSIIGTKEAFAGIDADFEKIGGLANSADEFIRKINSYDFEKKFNEYAYLIFESNFSDEALQAKINNFFKENT